MRAREVPKVKAKEQPVFIRLAADPNSDFLNGGQREVLKAAMDKRHPSSASGTPTAGRPENAAEEHGADPSTRTTRSTRWWPPTTARLAAWVMAALRRSAERAGLGPRTATWPLEPRGVAAGDPSRSGRDAPASSAIRRRLRRAAGNGTPRGQTQGAAPRAAAPKDHHQLGVPLKPVPITKDNLKTVIDAGWVTKAQVCRGVDARQGPGRLQVMF